MKRVIFSIVFLSVFCIFSCTDNKLKSITPGKIWPDNNGVHINAHGGGLLFQGGIYYWYGEHKIGGKAGNTAQVGVHCYSSKDLYNWKDEGIALTVFPENSGSDIEKGCVLERPKVIYNALTGKYVMWFHLELKGNAYNAARCGMAIADNPTGPYQFVKSFRPDVGTWPINFPLEKKDEPVGGMKSFFGGSSVPQHPDSMNIVRRDMDSGQQSRDMTVFVDDDGKAYHIYSSESNSTLHISLLTDDYQDYAGKYARFFSGRFMEAPAIFKKDGKYYLIMSGCSGWTPNAGRSAVASSIWGPWKELDNPFQGDDANTSFHSQSTYILPYPGNNDRLIYLGDRWNPEDAIDGRYIWLPIEFDGEQPVIHWKDEWKLN
ncbi:MAG: glycoside hydrolase family 43 protein [Candidatus Symbiothrix sp.]|jgi:hypothetical protein|nr:glycoside hydrolase family 43 protein [Candidatus Symbiothrix sp.]